jgi:hypothetical protein
MNCSSPAVKARLIVVSGCSLCHGLWLNGPIPLHATPYMYSYHVSHKRVDGISLVCCDFWTFKFWRHQLGSQTFSTYELVVFLRVIWQPRLMLSSLFLHRFQSGGAESAQVA